MLHNYLDNVEHSDECEVFLAVRCVEINVFSHWEVFMHQVLLLAIANVHYNENFILCYDLPFFGPYTVV